MYLYNTSQIPRQDDGKDAVADGAMNAADQQQQQQQQHQQQYQPPPSPAPVPVPVPSSSSSAPFSHPGPNPSSSSPHTSHPVPSHNSKPTPLDPSSRSKRHSLPFSFPLLHTEPANTSSTSTSLAPSTAEGRPIPLDNDTTAHRTLALRQLNSTYPSPVNGHRYAKSTGAQSSTYSQPVIVRTYSGLSRAQSAYGGNGGHAPRPSSSTRGGSRRVPLLPRHSASLSGQPSKPALSNISPGSGIGAAAGIGTASDAGMSSSSSSSSRRRNGSKIGSIRPPQTKKSSKPPLRLPWQWASAAVESHHALRSAAQDEPKLPPVQAFSFKGFMADLQAQGGQTDITADLDRIAEICARSRYSLSNQYEVHMAPHGSGSSFAADGTPSSVAGRRRGPQASSHGTGSGPTLQAIGSDDDENSGPRASRKRRGGGRRRSVAYSTLETIMSSSRSSQSSEEDKTRKKPAVEISEEARGRAARKDVQGAPEPEAGSGSGSGSGSRSESQSVDNGKVGALQTEIPGKDIAQSESGAGHRSEPKRSASFATMLMDSTRQAWTTSNGNGNGNGNSNSNNTSTPRTSASALVSEPALPQTSTSHLEIRTGPGSGSDSGHADEHEQASQSQPASPRSANQADEVRFAEDLPHPEEPLRAPSTSLLSGLSLSSWIPWRTQAADGDGRVPSGNAEGRLRLLLGTTADAAIDKGKAVDYES